VNRPFDVQHEPTGHWPLTAIHPNGVTPNHPSAAAHRAKAHDFDAFLTPLGTAVLLNHTARPGGAIFRASKRRPVSPVVAVGQWRGEHFAVAPWRQIPGSNEGQAPLRDLLGGLRKPVTCGDGGAEGIRTPDPLDANEVRYQAAPQPRKRETPGYHQPPGGPVLTAWGGRRDSRPSAVIA
jgi:hypothetical protein